MSSNSTPVRSSRVRRLLLVGGAAAVLLAGCGWLLRELFPRQIAPDKVRYFANVDSRPSPLSTWPWTGAKRSNTHRGVTHWFKVSADGTNLHLLEFDFAANPNLRFEMYDQDQDDGNPWDNRVDYWPRAVGQATKHLNDRFAKQKRGKVVAAWNGLFYGYYSGSAGQGLAHHVSPVIVDNKLHNFGPNRRWTFGVQYTGGKPHFKVLHLADKATLAREFDWGGGGAQCLVKEGKPLKLQPFPREGEKPLPQPVPSTPADVGHIPLFDHMRTSRASIAWSRDNRMIFVLWVREPDNEAGSSHALLWGEPLQGGWTVPDLQRFWISMKGRGVWTAINSDAGDVMQSTLLRPDDRYDLVPSGQGRPSYLRRTFTPDFKGAPVGGALMYFYVRDSGG